MRLSMPLLLALLLPCLDAAVAAADWNLEVVEQDGQAEIHVLTAADHGEPYVGWIVTREIRGVCDPPEAVTGLIPFPRVMDVENDPGLADTTLVVALPYENILYLFRAYLVDDQGAWVPPGNTYRWPPFESQDYLGYGDCIVLRGTLFPMQWSGEWVDLYIAECLEGCWTSTPELGWLGTFASDDPLLQYLWRGVIDVYGVPTEQDGMLHAEPYRIYHVEPAPDGACAPVAADEPALDSFKAMFR